MVQRIEDSIFIPFQTKHIRCKKGAVYKFVELRIRQCLTFELRKEDISKELESLDSDVWMSSVKWSYMPVQVNSYHHSNVEDQVIFRERVRGIFMRKLEKLEQQHHTFKCGFMLKKITPYNTTLFSTPTCHYNFTPKKMKQ